MVDRAFLLDAIGLSPAALAAKFSDTSSFLEILHFSGAHQGFADSASGTVLSEQRFSTSHVDVSAPQAMEEASIVASPSFIIDRLNLSGADDSATEQLAAAALSGADAYSIGPTNAKWGGGSFGTSGGVVTWSYIAPGTALSSSVATDFSSEGVGTSLSSPQSFLPGTFNSYLSSAFAAWAQVANISFIQVADDGAAIGANSVADIRISGVSIDGSLNTLAFTYYPGQGAISGEIFLDTSDAGFFSSPMSALYLVVAHEIGHAIGLGHSANSGALMAPYYNEALSGLQADDIAGAQAIYGAAQPGAAKVYNLPTGITSFTLLDAGITSNLTVNGNVLGNLIQGSNINNDTINGLAGNDSIYGWGGNDVLSGGDGDDIIDAPYGGISSAAGADTLIGGAGNDTYYVDNLGDAITEGAGEGAQDWVYASVSGYTMATNVEVGVVNIAAGGRLNGNGGDNILFGSGAADQLYGMAGNDQFGGGAGNDTIDGGDGNDSIGGNEGDDTLIGGAGNDGLYGQAGNDTFRYDATGWGADTIGDFMAGSASGDVLNFTGLGLSYSDFSFAQVGANTVITRIAGGETIKLVGVTLGNLNAGDFVGLAGSFPAFGSTINGTAGADTLTGTSGADVIYGFDGNDTINGLGGADTLIGGAGNDTYYVDNLGDAITEGAGEGAQDWVYASVSGYTMATNVEVGVVNIASGGRLNGNGGDNILFGSGAADQLYGMAGNDQFGGGAGNDTIDGGDGNDSIGGNEGDDTLIGGAGNDGLYGQAGNDLFIFSAGSGIDRIMDFTAGVGVGDRVELNGYGGFTNFTDVQAALSQSGSYAVLDLGGGNQIMFADLTPAQFAADDFLFS